MNALFGQDQIQRIRSRLDEVEQGLTSLPGTVSAMLERAALITGMSLGRIVSPARDGATCWVRNAVIHAAAQKEGRKLSAIGRAIGGRDHTTISYSLTRAAELLATDDAFRQLCDMLAAGEAADRASIGDDRISGCGDLFPPGPLFQFDDRRELAQ